MAQTQKQAIEEMTAALAGEKMPDWSVQQRLAVGCRILAAHGHGSGLAGQFTARGDAPETMWTLPYGLGFEQATASDYLLVDKDLKVPPRRAIHRPHSSALFIGPVDDRRAVAGRPYGYDGVLRRCRAFAPLAGRALRRRGRRDHHHGDGR